MEDNSKYIIKEIKRIYKSPKYNICGKYQYNMSVTIVKTFYDKNEIKVKGIKRARHNRYCFSSTQENISFCEWDDNGAPAYNETILYSTEYSANEQNNILQYISNEKMALMKKLLGMENKYCDFHFIKILKIMFGFDDVELGKKLFDYNEKKIVHN